MVATQQYLVASSAYTTLDSCQLQPWSQHWHQCVALCVCAELLCCDIVACPVRVLPRCRRDAGRFGSRARGLKNTVAVHVRLNAEVLQQQLEKARAQVGGCS